MKKEKVKCEGCGRLLDPRGPATITLKSLGDFYLHRLCKNKPVIVESIAERLTRIINQERILER